MNKKCFTVEKMEWQLSMGRHDYDWFIKLCNREATSSSEGKDYKNDTLFEYPRGSAKMKEVPKQGDEIYVTCRGQLLCKCSLVEPFTDYSNAILFIQEVYAHPIKLNGRRRNWTKFTW